MFARYLRLAYNYGILYAMIQKQIDSKTPLDAEATWKFWTEPKNSVLMWLANHWPALYQRKKLLDTMLSPNHAAGIEAHYDVSNEFYRLWLDKEFMFYTCAKFENPGDTLEKAQANKAAFLLSLLDPKPGERILDLGCGWGGMMKAIRKATDGKANLLGVTLSKEQLAYVKEQGLLCEYNNFITMSYGSWDKIYSIGSMEHVRGHEIESLHRKLFDALPPGGCVIHQFFSSERKPFHMTAITSQHFFPGSMLSPHKDFTASVERAGFKIEVDVTDDYRPTLRAWFDNFVHNKEKILQLVGVTTYNKYLVFFPASWRFFDDGNAKLHRMLLRKV